MKYVCSDGYETEDHEEAMAHEKVAGQLKEVGESVSSYVDSLGLKGKANITRTIRSIMGWEAAKLRASVA
jgi:hypothetical protein